MTANNQMRTFGSSLGVWSPLRRRNFVLPYWVLLAWYVFSQLSFLNAQPAPNRVLELDGNGSYVELPPNIFKDLEEATVEGWEKWKETFAPFRFRPDMQVAAACCSPFQNPTR